MADDGFNINLDIKFTENSVAELMKSFKGMGEKLHVGEARAMNRTAKEMRTEAKREILKVYTIKSNKVLKAMVIIPYDDHFVLSTTGAVFSAIDFKYTKNSHMSKTATIVKTKSGFAMVKQRIWEIVLETKRGQTVTMKDAFMRPIKKTAEDATKKEKKHIFVRHPGEDAHLVLGPSVPAMLGSLNVLPHVIEYGQERLQKNMQQQIKFIMDTEFPESRGAIKIGG